MSSDTFQDLSSSAVDVRGCGAPIIPPPQEIQQPTMRFLHSLLPSILLLGASVAEAATWGFDEAVISVTGKGGAGSAFKDKYVSFPSF